MRKPSTTAGCVLRSAGPCRPVGAILALLGGACVGPLSDSARADIFVLKGQGEVRGQLVNGDESPRKTYVIKTPSGGQVTLSAEQVEDVKPQSAVEMKYDRYRGDAPDTVDGQWKLAEWCRQNRLLKQRKVHLRRIVELDPNHADARHALGYGRFGGRWVTQEQLMVENGYVRSKLVPGKWVLPQEEALLEARNKTKRSQLEWNAKLKRWSGWLNTDKAPNAVANIKAIDDPFAVPALAKHLKNDSRRDARLLYIAALGHTNSAGGMEVLVGTSLQDPDDEIRMSALDEIVARHYRPAVGKYIQALKNTDNAVINRAGVALGKMKDPSAIRPLIESLVTTHTFRLQQGQPGQTSTTFGTGPNSGGFSFGGSKVKVVKQQYKNPAVLQALVELTGGVSYNYDLLAWRNWYVAQKKPKALDARRDSSQ